MTQIDRKTRIRHYKETLPPAGVFRVRNTATGKSLVGSTANMQGPKFIHEALTPAVSPFWHEISRHAILTQIEIREDVPFHITGPKQQQCLKGAGRMVPCIKKDIFPIRDSLP